MWAYFGVVSWTAGSLCSRTLGESLAKSAGARVLLILLLIPMLYVPLTRGRNLQTFPPWGYSDFSVFNGVPTCVVDAAKFIRTHSSPQEVIQDSEGDPRLVLTALAERAEFAVDYDINVQRPAGLARRLEELKLFKTMTDEHGVAEFARSRGITWYVLHPKTTVGWPHTLSERVAFSCDAFRVYRFD